MPDFSTLCTWADKLLSTAESAGKEILGIRSQGFTVDVKDDASPVTEADRVAESIIIDEIEKISPAFPIVAEERVSSGDIPEINDFPFWLIDALDGTKEFIKNGSDFTVNIALVYDSVPILGIVHAPAKQESFVGVIGPKESGRRAEVWRKKKSIPISVRKRPRHIIVAGSRSHEVPKEMELFLHNYDVNKRIVVGSSLKFCLVAEGLADLYPRFGPTHEWDTGAGHAVLKAAGGRVHTFDGTELRYKKVPNFLNGKFLADGGP
ncbi:MAG: 3'(2'),5'-bisphosphate nucleotidase [Candidatus Marinimicrobia bacterium]|nr:3'(2'),5'-bisphosphate nucleotidase [Candidatus Neomarinimicrobiota bacterium]